jgi:hypothetical protein
MTHRLGLGREGGLRALVEEPAHGARHDAKHRAPLVLVQEVIAEHAAAARGGHIARRTQRGRAMRHRPEPEPVKHRLARDDPPAERQRRLGGHHGLRPAWRLPYPHPLCLRLEGRALVLPALVPRRQLGGLLGVCSLQPVIVGLGGLAPRPRRHRWWLVFVLRADQHRTRRGQEQVTRGLGRCKSCRQHRSGSVKH